MLGLFKNENSGKRQRRRRKKCHFKKLSHFRICLKINLFRFLLKTCHADVKEYVGCSTFKIAIYFSKLTAKAYYEPLIRFSSLKRVEKKKKKKKEISWTPVTSPICFLGMRHIQQKLKINVCKHMLFVYKYVALLFDCSKSWYVSCVVYFSRIFFSSFFFWCTQPFVCVCVCVYTNGFSTFANRFVNIM